MTVQDNIYLLMAGMASLGIAVLHAVIIYIGPDAYRFFEAGEDMAHMAEIGSFIPTALTIGISLVFIVFALYAFSGGRILKPLPFLNPILLLIGIIYGLRGLASFYFIYMLIFSADPEMFKNLVFSLVSLFVGILYIAGWTVMKKGR